MNNIRINDLTSTQPTDPKAQAHTVSIVLTRSFAKVVTFLAQLSADFREVAPHLCLVASFEIAFIGTQPPHTGVAFTPTRSCG